MRDSSFAHGVTIQKTTTDIFTAVGTSSLYRNNLVCKVKKPEVRRRYNKHAHDTEPLHLEIRTNVVSTYHLGFGVPVVAFHPHFLYLPFCFCHPACVPKPHNFFPVKVFLSCFILSLRSVKTVSVLCCYQVYQACTDTVPHHRVIIFS